MALSYLEIIVGIAISSILVGIIPGLPILIKELLTAKKEKVSQQ